MRGFLLVFTLWVGPGDHRGGEFSLKDLTWDAVGGATTGFALGHGP